VFERATQRAGISDIQIRYSASAGSARFRKKFTDPIQSASVSRADRIEAVAADHGAEPACRFARFNLDAVNHLRRRASAGPIGSKMMVVSPSMRKTAVWCWSWRRGTRPGQGRLQTTRRWIQCCLRSLMRTWYGGLRCLLTTDLRCSNLHETLAEASRGCGIRLVLHAAEVITWAKR